MTSTSFATGFEGGPIFPLLFVGGTLGLAISKILTFIPEGVAVTAGMAGVTCAVFPLPVTVILLLGLLGGQTDLLPGIAIGAVVGLIVSKALTPLLPKRGTKSGAVLNPKQIENISSHAVALVVAAGVVTEGRRKRCNILCPYEDLAPYHDHYYLYYLSHPW